MTIGEDITTTITDALHNSQSEGTGVVPCETLWRAVANGRQKNDPFYGRYRSVLSELIRTAKVKMHRDEESGLPVGFESLNSKKH